jgi:hypothetical protein
MTERRPPPARRRRRRLAALLAAALTASACADGALESAPAAEGPGERGPLGGSARPGGEPEIEGPGNEGSGGAETDPADPEAGGAETPNGRQPEPFSPSPAVLPRLTTAQYRNTLEDLFGPDLPRTPLEPDTNPYLFWSIGAATTSVSELGVEQYAEAAFLIAETVFADETRRSRALSCAPTAPDDACIDAYVRGLGRRLYRRPLAEDEVARWVGVSRDTAEGDALRGAESVLAGLLQSPAFLYRVESGEPAPGGDDTARRYTSYEMAARLAFFLTEAGPDDVLLDAAERGELVEPDALEAQARRLLATPRARAALQGFFAQYLDLGRLEHIELDPALFPGFSRGLVRAMETEVRLLVDDLVFRRGGDIRRLFSAPRGYVNADLAALYGVSAPGATATAFVPVSFPADVPRAGVLTLGAFLTMNAHRIETSPTLRGKYIRERVLCQDVPPPPANVSLDLERTEGDPPTLRERLEQHRENPACAGCHAFIDPPGFLFENYDSMGRFREAVDGYPVDATGDLDGVPLNDALDLARALESHPRVGACITRQLYRFANSRLDTRGDRAALTEIEAAFAEAGYDFQALVLALVRSEGFRTLAAPEAAE